MGIIESPSLPREVNNILIWCQSEQQRFVVEEIRNQLIEEYSLEEKRETRHLKYQKNGQPCAEIIFKDQRPIPQILLLLPEPKKSIGGILSKKRCRYGLGIDQNGEVAEEIYFYQVRKMQLKYCIYKSSITMTAVGKELLAKNNVPEEMANSTNFLWRMIQIACAS